MGTGNIEKLSKTRNLYDLDHLWLFYLLIKRIREVIRLASTLRVGSS